MFPRNGKARLLHHNATCKLFEDHKVNKIKHTQHTLLRTTLYDLLLVSNSTSTSQFLPLIELVRLPFGILRNGFPNRPKHKASSKVDLPEPLTPTINVLMFLSKSISEKWLPVLNRFFHFTFLNIINQFLPCVMLQHIILSLMF